MGWGRLVRGGARGAGGEFEDADLFLGLGVIGLVGGVGLNQFVEDQEGEEGAAVEAVGAPIEDVLGNLGGDVGAVFGFAFPVDQAVGAAHANDFGDDVLGLSGNPSFYSGAMAEVLVFAGVLGDAKRVQVERYLMARFNLL